MRSLEDLEIGVMFWAGRDSLAEAQSAGVHCGQLGVPGRLPLSANFAGEWKSTLERENFPLATVFAAYEGEDYADIPTVKRTVGFIPRETRAEREIRTCAVSDFAAAIGVRSIACHVGFVPEDRRDADYLAVRDIVRRVCDHAAANGQTFALETGQEPPRVLLRFMEDAGRENLKINFDPANLILYGSSDPIEALEALGAQVVSVHCKDGDWPPKERPGALGTERPLGQGSVGIPRFVAALKHIGYRGILSVEREASDPAGRWRDIHAAVELLSSLRR